MNKIILRNKDWLILIGYVALIYGTLPFMPKISSFFSSLFGKHFGTLINLLLIGIIVGISASIFKHNPGRKGPVFYAAIAILFTSYLTILLFATPIVAEKLHLLEYGFLSCLALRVVKNIQSLWKQNLHIILIIISVGYCDELIQKFTPGRYYETKDVILNIISGILGLVSIRLFN